MIKPSIALALCLGLATVAAHAQVAVIVNPKSPLASLSTEQASALFLGKSSGLPGSGGPAQLTDLPEGSAVRDQFYAKTTGKSAAQVKAVWSRLTFSGRGAPPRELANAAEVKKLVAANADTVGYIERSAVDATVKAVLIID